MLEPTSLSIDDGSDLFLDDTPAQEDTSAPKETTPEDAAETQPEPEQNQQPEKVEDTPQTLKIKYNGEEKEITFEEAVILAQKGMNYDHAVEKLTNAREFQILDKLATQSGLTRDKLLEQLETDYFNAQVTQEVEQLKEHHPDASDAVLKELAKKNVNERLRDVQEQQRQEKEQAKLKPWKDFMETYPQYKDVKDIPQPVMEAFRKGESLIGAMRQHEIKEKDKEIQDLKKQLETKQKNDKNKVKSLGSVAGNAADDPVDAFLMGFNS